MNFSGFLFPSVEHGGKGLVDKVADDCINEALAESEGNIEYKEAVKEGIGGGHLSDGSEYCLIHAHYCLKGEAIKFNICGVYEPVVEGQGLNCHYYASHDAREYCAAPGALSLVDKARSHGKEAAAEEVEKLANAG